MGGVGRSDRSLMAAAAAAVAESTGVKSRVLSSSSMLVWSAVDIGAASDRAEAKGAMAAISIPTVYPTKRAGCISTSKHATAMTTADSGVYAQNNANCALNYLPWDGLYC